jgi:hypothetical protein
MKIYKHREERQYMQTQNRAHPCDVNEEFPAFYLRDRQEGRFDLRSCKLVNNK